MSEEFYNSYLIDTISDENGIVYDLFVSADDGYTWEFYNWYDDIDLAHAEGVSACKRAAGVE
jgi:hypothetical protein